MPGMTTQYFSNENFEGVGKGGLVDSDRANRAIAVGEEFGGEGLATVRGEDDSARGLFDADRKWFDQGGDG